MMKLLRIICLNCLRTTLDGYLIMEEAHIFHARISLFSRTNLFKFEDKSSKEGGDDGNRLITFSF